MITKVHTLVHHKDPFDHKDPYKKDSHIGPTCAKRELHDRGYKKDSRHALVVGYGEKSPSLLAKQMIYLYSIGSTRDHTLKLIVAAVLQDPV